MFDLLDQLAGRGGGGVVVAFGQFPQRRQGRPADRDDPRASAVTDRVMPVGHLVGQRLQPRLDGGLGPARARPAPVPAPPRVLRIAQADQQHEKCGGRRPAPNHLSQSSHRFRSFPEVTINQPCRPPAIRRRPQSYS